MNPSLPTTPSPTSVPSSKKKYKLYLGALALLIILISIVAFYYLRSASKNPVTSTIPPAIVSIDNSGFIPSTISIKKGQAVVWTNNDSSPHEVAADPYPLDNGIPGFNSTEVLLNRDSYSFIFSEAGTYHYHDQLNPFKLHGTVDVTQ